MTIKEMIRWEARVDNKTDLLTEMAQKHMTGDVIDAIKAKEYDKAADLYAQRIALDTAGDFEKAKVTAMRGATRTLKNVEGLTSKFKITADDLSKFEQAIKNLGHTAPEKAKQRKEYTKKVITGKTKEGEEVAASTGKGQVSIKKGLDKALEKRGREAQSRMEAIKKASTEEELKPIADTVIKELGLSKEKEIKDEDHSVISDFLHNRKQFSFETIKNALVSDTERKIEGIS